MDTSTCAECQRDLAAYIDYEYVAGPAAANQRYPHVWWHMQHCPTCAELCRMTRLLADATRVGEIALPSLPPTLPRFLSLGLDTRKIRQTLAVQTQLGVAWGNAPAGVVVADATNAGYHICVSLQLDTSTTCALLIVSTPAFAGQVALLLGNQRYTAPFKATGTATVAAVPVAALVAADPSSLSLAFEPES